MVLRMRKMIEKKKTPFIIHIEHAARGKLDINYYIIRAVPTLHQLVS